MTSPFRAAAAALAAASLPLAQSTIHDHVGAAADSFGQVCDVAGDLDLDGRAETLVGAWRDDPGGLTDAGAVHVFDGATGALAFAVPGLGAGDHMGFGSSAAGDVNGDGHADLCAAADEDDVEGVGANAGSARIVSGLDRATLWTFAGEDAGDLFGWSTAAAGDVDGDGFDDVLISALLAEEAGGPSNAGSITAYSGKTGQVIHRIYGDAINGRLGSNVGRAGDVNADGRADLIAVQATRVRVFSGLDASVLHDVVVAGGGSAGLKVSGADVDGDGRSDLIVGASGAASGAGEVRVLSGVDASVLHVFTGDQLGDNLGAAVAGAGDLDGDGYADLVAGQPGSDVGGASSGALRAFSGRTGLVLFTIHGDAANRRLGAAAGAGADVDLDGFPDAIGSATSGFAKTVSFTPQGIQPFGAGTPGCDGPQQLLANGVPALGTPGFALHGSHAPPAGPAFVALGDTPLPAGAPVLGALLHVAPPPAGGFLLPLAAPPADAHGSIVAPLPIPQTPALAGAVVVAQIGTLWPSGPCAGAFTSSNGIALTIQ